MMNKYILTITDAKERIFTHHVCIEAENEQEARSTFNNDYNGYEVEVSTMPYDGTSMETVFAPTERVAELIATSRSGEYSDVPNDVFDLGMDVKIASVDDPETVDERVADMAQVELQHVNRN